MGCASVTTFEPVAVPDFEFEMRLEQRFEQGDHAFTEDQLQELLPDLILDMPLQNFVFYFDLVDVELEHEFDVEETAEIKHQLVPEPLLVMLDMENIVSFGDIVLYHAGVYTFKIAQRIESIVDWEFDETIFYIVVTVTEDVNSEVLVADIELTTKTFTNIFTVDITEEIDTALERVYQERLIGMQAELEEIEAVFLSLGGITSFYFKNLETGFRHGFNENHVFHGASTPKIWYNHWLYVQDELGHITLTNQERSWIEISLLRSLDEFSLNLQQRYGLDNYHAWLEENGVTILQSNANHHFGLRTRLTATEGAILMDSVYQYFLTETPNAIEFRENMRNNEAPFIVSDNYEVASKTGWLWPQRVRHDVAIVEAASPYILVILSEDSRTALDLPYNEPYYFRMLSQLFEDFNNRWFVID